MADVDHPLWGHPDLADGNGGEEDEFEVEGSDSEGGLSDTEATTENVDPEIAKAQRKHADKIKSEANRKASVFLKKMYKESYVDHNQKIKDKEKKTVATRKKAEKLLISYIKEMKLDQIKFYINTHRKFRNEAQVYDEAQLVENAKRLVGSDMKLKHASQKIPYTEVKRLPQEFWAALLTYLDPRFTAAMQKKYVPSKPMVKALCMWCCMLLDKMKIPVSCRTWDTFFRLLKERAKLLWRMKQNVGGGAQKLQMRLHLIDLENREGNFLGPVQATEMLCYSVKKTTDKKVVIKHMALNETRPIKIHPDDVGNVGWQGILYRDLEVKVAIIKGHYMPKCVDIFDETHVYTNEKGKVKVVVQKNVNPVRDIYDEEALNRMADGGPLGLSEIRSVKGKRPPPTKLATTASRNDGGAPQPQAKRLKRTEDAVDPKTSSATAELHERLRVDQGVASSGSGLTAADKEAASGAKVCEDGGGTGTPVDSPGLAGSKGGEAPSTLLEENRDLEDVAAVCDSKNGDLQPGSGEEQQEDEHEEGDEEEEAMLQEGGHDSAMNTLMGFEEDDGAESVATERNALEPAKRLEEIFNQMGGAKGGRGAVPPDAEDAAGAEEFEEETLPNEHTKRTPNEEDIPVLAIANSPHNVDEDDPKDGGEDDNEGEGGKTGKGAGKEKKPNRKRPAATVEKIEEPAATTKGSLRPAKSPETAKPIKKKPSAAAELPSVAKKVKKGTASTPPATEAPKDAAVPRKGRGRGGRAGKAGAATATGRGSGRGPR